MPATVILPTRPATSARHAVDTGLPSQPPSLTEFLEAKPACSPQLLAKLQRESARAPPRVPPWTKFLAATSSWDLSVSSLQEVIAYIAPFLHPADIGSINCVAHCFSTGPLFADIRLFPPWPPMRNRLFGARKRNPLLCTRHDQPSPFLIFHHCWAFLYPNDRLHLCNAFPIMLDYAKLHQSVASESVASL
jgi:hypothetical protein